MAVTFILSGCGQNADSGEPGREPQSVQTDSSQTDKSESTENSENTESSGNTQDNAGTESKALVAYFAYSENMGDTSSMSVDAIASASLNRDTKNTEGNLQVMAQAITEKTGADTFHIIMTDPYDPDYSTMLPRAIQEMEDEDWPALESKIENIDDYDVVYLGVPVWNAEIPPALHTFFTENDLSGKKIILFGIHLGSGLGRMEGQVQELASGAELVDSFTISASTANDDVRKEFSEWLDGLSVN